MDYPQERWDGESLSCGQKHSQVGDIVDDNPAFLMTLIGEHMQSSILAGGYLGLPIINCSQLAAEIEQVVQRCGKGMRQGSGGRG
jgi:hypothetical protein